MRPYRTLLTALAVACASLATPASASRGTWLEGSTTGWVDFTVKTEQTLRSATITATGRYGGFYVTRTDRSLSAFGVLVTDGATQPLALGDAVPPDERVEPGVTYRLYLIADGHTLVNFPGLRLATKTLRPKHRARSTFASGPLVKGAGETWRRAAPIDMSGTLAVSLMFATSTSWVLFDGTTCIVREEDAAAGCDGGGYGFPSSRAAYPDKANDSNRRWPYQTQRLTLIPSRYVAIQQLAHPLGDGWGASGLTFTLTLV